MSRERQHQKYSKYIYEIYDYKCWICGKSDADTIDHIVPVLWGGSDHPANLKPAHRSCNSSRGAARPPRECWSIPPMWLDGYGPKSRTVEEIYPRPEGVSLIIFMLLLLGSVALTWLGFRFHVGLFSVLGMLGVGMLVLVPYVRWWYWNFASHRIAQAAKNDETPPEPGEWLQQAAQFPPGLRQIGQSQKHTNL